MSRTKKIEKNIAYLLFFGLLSSCLTPIDFETDNKGGLLAVSGQISTVLDRSIVQLGQTSGDKRLPIPVSGALLKLVDSNGEASNFVEDLTNKGLYTLPNRVARPGGTYHLEITIEGKIYKSSPEKLPETVGSLSTYYEVSNEEFTDFEGTVLTRPFLKLYTNSLLPKTTPVYLKWSVEEAFILSPTDFPDPFGNTPPSCFIVQNADPQRIVLYNGLEIQSESIKNQLVGSRIVDYSFLERHYFTTYQSALTKEAYEYWIKVNILANQVGSIFDSPPAEITGNITNINDPSEKILGYFQAVNETSDRFFLLPTSLPFQLTMKGCTFDGSFRTSDYPVRWINCRSVRNSSFTRPNWF